MRGETPPIEIQRIGGKRYKHGAGTKVDPFRGIERPHAGIDKGIACNPVRPPHVGILIPPMKVLGSRVDTAPFHPVKALEFLQKMIPPAKARNEAADFHACTARDSLSKSSPRLTEGKP